MDLPDKHAMRGRKRPAPQSAPSQWQKMRKAAHKQATAATARMTTMGSLLWYLPMLGCLTMLQSVAVTPASAINYDWHVMELLRYMDRTNLSPAPTLTSMDRTVAQFFDHMIEEDAQPAFGEKLLAGLSHRLPWIPGTVHDKFPGSSRSLKGWRRLKPPSTRPPLPFEAMLLIAVSVCVHHKMAMGIAIVMGFFGYLRPRELTDLLSSQLVPPMTRGLARGKALSFWNIVLHSFEGLKASKTGRYDENLPMDSKWLQGWFPAFLEALHGARKDCHRLWSFTHEELLAAYRMEIRRLGLDALVQNLYGLRHGGASFDTLFRQRDPLGVKIRGRWASDKSLIRYRKASIAQRETQKMSDAQLSVAKLLAESPGHYFEHLSDTLAALRPILCPVTKSSRSSTA